MKDGSNDGMIDTRKLITMRETWLWLKSNRQKKECRKLQPRYSGTYRVTHVHDNNTVDLGGDWKGRTKRVTTVRIFKFRSRESGSEENSCTETRSNKTPVIQEGMTSQDEWGLRRSTRKRQQPDRNQDLRLKAISKVSSRNIRIDSYVRILEGEV